jgi:hypothetical protein
MMTGSFSKNGIWMLLMSKAMSALASGKPAMAKASKDSHSSFRGLWANESEHEWFFGRPHGVSPTIVHICSGLSISKSLTEA